MGLESDSCRLLLESSGWLAAHRRKQFSLKQDPVRYQLDSLTGEVSPASPLPEASQGWRSFSLRLVKRLPSMAEEGPDPYDA